MKIIVKQFLTTSITILLTFTHTTKSSDDCNPWPELNVQCTCIESQIDIKSTSYCNGVYDKRICKEFKNGVLEVALPILLTYNTSYNIQLLVNEGVTTSNVCDRNFNKTEIDTDIEWKKHSEIKYNIYNIEQCSSSAHLNNTCKTHNVPTVTFDYIFSGCYILEIVSLISIYKSHPTYITSSYKKKRLVDNQIITMLEPHCREGQECIISTKLNSTYIPKPPSINSTLMRRDCNENCSTLTAVTKVNYKNNFKEYSRTFTPCQELLNITWNCSYLEKEINNITRYICKYIGLSRGSYRYGFSLLDENTRCNEDSIWAAPGNSCREEHLDFDVLEDKSNNKSNFNIPTDDVHPAYFIIPILIILVCLFIFLYKQYRNLNHQKVTIEQSYQYLAGEDLTLINTTDILIIYARDSEIFAAMIESFKELLRSVDKNVCIHDINVDNESMWSDPENWIRNKISSKHTKFILFLNQCGSLLFEKQIVSANSSKIAYRNPKWYDNMFIYALKQLEIAKTINHTNLFVTVTSVCNTCVFNHINPDTRFVMPNSIHKLLKHIFPNVEYYNESFLQEFNNCCHTYSKFCEVNLNYVTDILNIE